MATEGGLFIGLMSGTSLDGVDGVLVEFSATGRVKRLLAHHHAAFEPALHGELLALQAEGSNELHRAAMASNALAAVYAEITKSLLRTAQVDAEAIVVIAAHGQTVRHRPELGYTIQLNNPSLLAELTAIPVVSDFRSRDVAAGGHGAPLVPAFHQAAFAKAGRVRLIVNLGGIANVTRLDGTERASGYDIGPANVLLDLWAQRHLGEPFDRNGAWASIGEADEALLARFLEEPFFAAAAPKSTGRDLFNAAWLDRCLADYGHLAPEDVQRTLAVLTAELVVREAGRDPIAGEVMLCGGGAYNLTVREAIENRLGALPHPPRLTSSQDYGIAPEHMEALAFAWLGWCHVNDASGNLPDATGADDYRVLGSYTPH